MPAHEQPRRIGALVLAAGLSSRMGAFKPLMPLRGKRVIENTADSALAGGADFLCVVVGYRGDELSSLLSRRYGDRVRIVFNREYARTDMFRSVRLGLQAMPPCEAFFLLPGDMPLIRPRTFRELLEQRAASDTGVVFPVRDGRRQHPPLIDSRLIPQILAYQGEGGLGGLWRQHPEWISLLSVADEGVEIDLDTPSDYRGCLRREANGRLLPVTH